MSRKFNVICFGPKKERVKIVNFRRPKKNAVPVTINWKEMLTTDQK